MEYFGKINGLKFIRIFKKRGVIKLWFILDFLKFIGSLLKWLKKLNKVLDVILFLLV